METFIRDRKETSLRQAGDRLGLDWRHDGGRIVTGWRQWDGGRLDTGLGQV